MANIILVYIRLFTGLALTIVFLFVFGWMFKLSGATHVLDKWNDFIDSIVFNKY